MTEAPSILIYSKPHINKEGAVTGFFFVTSILDKMFSPMNDISPLSDNIQVF